MSAFRRTYGIMQGRLSPPENGRLQCFPLAGWRREFAHAHHIGLDYMEWIDDAYGYTANPIFTVEGRADLAALKQEHGVAILAICADWFMDFPLLRCTQQQRSEREQHLHTLLPIAAAIGAERVVIPLVDNAKIMTEDDQSIILAILQRALPLAEQCKVELHLESDLNPPQFSNFIAKIPHPFLKINWDSGNSSGLGYKAHEEFAAYGNRIGSIHFKDRYRSPDGCVTSRPLGEGLADFQDIFSSMRSIDYRGGITLQVARGKTNQEPSFVQTQLDFVKQHWSNL